MMNKMRNMLKSEAGFTLVELLVVLLVLGILASVAVPRFLDMRGKANLVKAKTELKQVQTAMELYYAEYGNYPAEDDFEDALAEYVEPGDLADYVLNYTIAGGVYTITTTFEGVALTITRINITD